MALSPIPRRRRRGPWQRTTTLALGAAAMATTVGVGAGELARVWRRGSAPLPADTDHVLEAAEVAARESVEVAVEGFRATSPRETALLNVLASFVVSFGAVRASTHTIRSRGTFGPFRDLRVGRRHVHHFVPGIVIAFVAGGVSIASRNEELDQWLALPFGTGVALTLDESALLLELEDVYWTEQGVLSVQITLSAIALLGALALSRRLLRRGEAKVLETGVRPPAA